MKSSQIEAFPGFDLEDPSSVATVAWSPEPAIPTTGFAVSDHDELEGEEDDDYEDEESGGVFDFLTSLGEAPAWAASLLIHLAILLILSTVVTESSVQELTAILTSIDDVEPENVFDTVVVDQVGNQGDLQSLTSAAMVATVRNTPQEEMQKQIEDEVLPPTIQVNTDEVDLPAQADMVAAVSTVGSALSTANTGGTEGAIDRLAMELAASLKERKTLVVWLFDASLSLQERRDAIADRFENVYAQLDALDVGADRALKTAAAAFGEKTTLLTQGEPVDDIRPLAQMVRNIKNDVSGKENVFAAVSEVCKKWQSYRLQSHRNMVLIIVTDERGDDFDKMEDTIAYVRRNGIKVYVVGNAAPFGKEKGYVEWKYEDDSTEDLPVDQGPETVAAEGIRLAYWGTNAADLERMSSGYGPYALTRLCAETGGMYLIADEDRKSKRFVHEVMQNYPPDYRPIKDYMADLMKNKAKAALVATALKTSVTNLPVPQLVFRADTDNALRTEITAAQQPIAVLDKSLSEMDVVLSEGEKDRDKISNPRWQASYDLAMGRVLAMRARVYGYNAVMAEMKVNPKPFAKKGNNQWKLVPSKEITSGPNVKKLASKAAMYLKRVVDDHPDTPWAMLAERELGQPMGWDWQEANFDYARLGMTADGKKNLLLLAEEEAKKKREKKQKAPEKPKPKL